MNLTIAINQILALIVSTMFSTTSENKTSSTSENQTAPISTSRERKYKEEVNKLHQLKSKLSDLKSEISMQRKKCLRAKTLFLHPYINVLEIYIPVMDIIQICLDYTGEKFCTKCDKIYPGTECIHNLSRNHSISYILRGALIYQAVCHCNLTYTYECYKVENEEDRNLLKYLHNNVDGVLCNAERDGCANHAEQYPFPFFLWNWDNNKLIIKEGHKITLTCDRDNDYEFRILLT